jgi:small subunit ribosomal protein S6
MNCYEHTFITRQDLPQSQSKTLLDKYEDIIKKNSGKIIKIEEWGLRNLSHIIKNNKKGFYFHIKLEGDGKTVEELEKAENIDEMLIRYLTVRVKKHDLEENFFVEQTSLENKQK